MRKTVIGRDAGIAGTGAWEFYDPKLHDGHTMTGTPQWEKY